MKHLFHTVSATIAMLVVSFSASAQYVPEWHQGDLTKKGARMSW